MVVIIEFYDAIFPELGEVFSYKQLIVCLNPFSPDGIWSAVLRNF